VRRALRDRRGKTGNPVFSPRALYLYICYRSVTADEKPERARRRKPPQLAGPPASPSRRRLAVALATRDGVWGALEGSNQRNQPTNQRKQLTKEATNQIRKQPGPTKEATKATVHRRHPIHQRLAKAAARGFRTPLGPHTHTKNTPVPTPMAPAPNYVRTRTIHDGRSGTWRRRAGGVRWRAARSTKAPLLFAICASLGTTSQLKFLGGHI
jgi:hypothetical protein